MQHSGYIACWITNKAATHQAVLGTQGLFETWGVQLVEEWIWCKVTTRGEPVTEVAGIWRKPYEVCLIGQRRTDAASLDHHTPQRRVIFGVPDLHSRKPCLKDLAARLLFGNEEERQESRDCAALELFARYAVAGWMSWGLEANKYNHRDWWVDQCR